MDLCTIKVGENEYKNKSNSQVFNFLAKNSFKLGSNVNRSVIIIMIIGKYLDKDMNRLIL